MGDSLSGGYDPRRSFTPLPWPCNALEKPRAEQHRTRTTLRIRNHARPRQWPPPAQDRIAVRSRLSSAAASARR
jgi:hypothetical protein